MMFKVGESIHTILRPGIGSGLASSIPWNMWSLFRLSLGLGIEVSLRRSMELSIREEDV